MTTPDIRRRAFTGGKFTLLAAFCAAALFPVFWMLTTALRHQPELFSVPPKWIPDEVTLDSFRYVWTETALPQYVLNSLIVVSAATLVSILFSSLAAYGMSRYEFRGKGTFLTFLLVTQMFPSIMLLIPYFQIIRTLGLYDTYAALVITYVSFTIPFCTWMMWGYMKSIPRELDEAAALDGCSPLGTFFRVVLPLSIPGVMATAIFSFITGWNEYIYALVLTQSDTMKTLPVGIGLLAGQDRIQWNDLMAAAIIAVIPLVIIFVLFQRHLVSGLTAGALK
ncbi:carbohydrate ABC transporter permease [Cellulomonas sp. KRMCY2]|uniref:carbohydrate ABC transporter permease n=1 Tax=Cellulomonas sp. KRMCY2 TaxID=1304865 RepID=UPI00045E9DF9|nr:carbohydrate ABC transporter permease [Cellulomonas sp. KRMCY2]